MLCGVPDLKRPSHSVNISAFPGFHKVNNNIRGSLFCDLFLLQLLGENSNPQALENGQKRWTSCFDVWGGLKNEEGDILDFVWSLDEESLCYLLVLAEDSIIFYLFVIFNTLESTVTRLSAHSIECIHGNALQLLCVYLDVKHLWPSFTAPCYLVFQTCNSIYLSLIHQVLLTTVQFLPSFYFARKCHRRTVFAKPW